MRRDDELEHSRSATACAPGASRAAATRRAAGRRGATSTRAAPRRATRVRIPSGVGVAGAEYLSTAGGQRQQGGTETKRHPQQSRRGARHGRMLCIHRASLVANSERPKPPANGPAPKSVSRRPCTGHDTRVRARALCATWVALGLPAKRDPLHATRCPRARLGRPSVSALHCHQNVVAHPCESICLDSLGTRKLGCGRCSHFWL